eukprot:g13785.t1
MAFLRLLVIALMVFAAEGIPDGPMAETPRQLRGRKNKRRKNRGRNRRRGRGGSGLKQEFVTAVMALDDEPVELITHGPITLTAVCEEGPNVKVTATVTSDEPAHVIFVGDGPSASEPLELADPACTADCTYVYSEDLFYFPSAGGNSIDEGGIMLSSGYYLGADGEMALGSTSSLASTYTTSYGTAYEYGGEIGDFYGEGADCVVGFVVHTAEF